ncbi:hypothetical protein M8C21_024017, partial [Ambrosia artemisiifolia]
EKKLYVLDEALHLTHQELISNDFIDEMINRSGVEMIDFIKGGFHMRRQWCLANINEIAHPMKFEHSVKDHNERLIGYIDRLNMLGYPMSGTMAIDTVFTSLPQEYRQFVTALNEKFVLDNYVLDKVSTNQNSGGVVLLALLTVDYGDGRLTTARETIRETEKWGCYPIVAGGLLAAYSCGGPTSCSAFSLFHSVI